MRWAWSGACSLAKRGDGRDARLRAIETEGSRVAEIFADEGFGARYCFFERAVLFDKGVPRDGAGFGIEVPESDETAAIEDGVVGKVGKAAIADQIAAGVLRCYEA